MLKTTFRVPKMDCSAEEALIRMKLETAPGITALQFDLPNRRLFVIHETDPESILTNLEPLGLGARLESSEEAEAGSASSNADESRILWTLLAINGVMFITEFGAGLVAQSAGLIADSLDMFADAAVYGVSLYAVGRAAALKVRAAHISGWIQIVLATGTVIEVARRFIFGSEPEPPFMMAVAAVALIANIACLILISKRRNDGAHMRASWIFSSNDVLANIGVIAAGALVSWTASSLPDLVIGAIIAVVVLTGGIRILRLQ